MLMKTSNPCCKSLHSNRWLAPSLCLVGGLLWTAFQGATSQPSGYAAHEWGTFTSVQGGDGVLLDWRPLQTSVLPKFVYDWSHPGLGRIAGFGQQRQVLVSKTALVTLQRMETPVLYFYSPQARTIDVSVKFPQGQITDPGAGQGSRGSRHRVPSTGIIPAVEGCRDRRRSSVSGACPISTRCAQAAITKGGRPWHAS